jgi:hypothetical protein
MDSLLRKDLIGPFFIPGLLMICENVLLHFVRKYDLFIFYPPKLLIFIRLINSENYVFRNHFG